MNQQELDKLTEKAYWEFDTLRKNDGERLSFKLIVKALMANMVEKNPLTFNPE